MASSSDVTQKVVDEVFQCIQTLDPESYQKLQADGAKKDDLIAQIRQIARDEVSQTEQLKQAGGDISKLILPPGQLIAIQDGLRMTSYEVDITDDLESVYGTGFVDGAKQLVCTADDLAYYILLAKVVIDAILLVMSVISLKPPLSKGLINKSSKEVAKKLTKSSAFLEAAEKFVVSWNNDSSNLDKASNLFFLLKEIHGSNMLWDIIKTLCSDMSQEDWIEAFASIGAQLFLAFGTKGMVLIAKIALVINDAYELSESIAKLQKMKKKLNK
jgi:hypothetical protein